MRTTFDFLGAADEPGQRARRQLLGVANLQTLPKMVGALALLGTHHAMVVCSDDDLDELSISAGTHVIEVVSGEAARSTTSPPRSSRWTLVLQAGSGLGGDPAENAAIMRAIPAG